MLHPFSIYGSLRTCREEIPNYFSILIICSRLPPPPLSPLPAARVVPNLSELIKQGTYSPRPHYHLGIVWSLVAITLPACCLARSQVGTDTIGFTVARKNIKPSPVSPLAAFHLDTPHHVHTHVIDTTVSRSWGVKSRHGLTTRVVSFSIHVACRSVHQIDLEDCLCCPARHPLLSLTSMVSL